MWGVEITRVHCDARYRDRRLANSLIRFPAIKSDADLTAIGDALKDERVLCWWNSNSGHWEAITGSDGATEAPPAAGGGQMEFVRVCGTTSNSCCLVEGVRLHVDPGETETFCAPNICIVPVWLWCYQGVEPNSEDVPIAEEKKCQFGRLIKPDHDCSGDIRDVYGIDCGGCAHRCPEEEVKVTVLTPVCCLDTEITFMAKCVLVDPMRPGTTGNGWWGEFEIVGDYPMIAYPLTVVPDPENGVPDTIFVVIGCETGNLCETDLYYIDPGVLGVDYSQFEGAFELPPGDPIVGLPVVITETIDEVTCALYCTRTYRYGVYFSCTAEGQLVDGKIYRLKPTSMADPTGVLDHCTIPPTQVPIPADSINGAGDDITFEGRGCEAMDLGDIDQNLSTAWSCEVELLGGAPPGTTISAEPFLAETFGGCRGWQGSGPSIPMCVPECEDEFITLRFDWSGTDECKEQ
jgi:hypothetical protein